ncbi:8461_t:CDS:2 [Ambispora gerdemannii]|uniref:8461_t:CDS:1 n=1 Tax=Ambispora gerdemannii TaxID=144530 RepID=A0A9N8W1C7_9GLOM|nr:8461_t:CDS:2 [Ambispora gerdemannii]
MEQDSIFTRFPFSTFGVSDLVPLPLKKRFFGSINQFQSQQANRAWPHSSSDQLLPQE